MNFIKCVIKEFDYEKAVYEALKAGCEVYWKVTVDLADTLDENNSKEVISYLEDHYRRTIRENVNKVLWDLEVRNAEYERIVSQRDSSKLNQS